MLTWSNLTPFDSAWIRMTPWELEIFYHDISWCDSCKGHQRSTSMLNRVENSLELRPQQAMQMTTQQTAIFSKFQQWWHHMVSTIGGYPNQEWTVRDIQKGMLGKIRQDQTSNWILGQSSSWFPFLMFTWNTKDWLPCWCIPPYTTAAMMKTSGWSAI